MNLRCASGARWIVGIIMLLPTSVVMADSAVAVPGAAERSRAQISATAQERSDGRVRLRVTTNGRQVAIRYRLDGSRHSMSRTAKRKHLSVWLPALSRAITVRALATSRLSASRWLRVPIGATPGDPADPAPGPGPVPGPADPVPGPTQPAPGPQDPAPAPTDPVAGVPDSSGFGDGSAAVTDDQLALAARVSVLFGHQSVGANILDGINGVYDARGQAPPPILEWPDTAAGGYLSHVYIGDNGDPMGKISHFAEVVRSAGSVRVALMKLCYVDIVADTDVDAVFDRYRATMADLARDRPDISLVYTTVPLTVGAGEDNAARQRFNAKIRTEYSASGRLFDLAAVESTRADGSRMTAGSGSYLTLDPDYAADSDGHLNDTGSQRAAAALLRIVATTAG